MSHCSICGESMPRGEEMFKFHGYSGPCPKPPLKKEVPMSRFDYVKYDDLGVSAQNTAKTLVSDVERFVESGLSNQRAKALALTKLEECYMWIGKAIRDDQIKRNGGAELLEERKDG